METVEKLSSEQLIQLEHDHGAHRGQTIEAVDDVDGIGDARHGDGCQGDRSGCGGHQQVNWRNARGPQACP